MRSRITKNGPSRIAAAKEKQTCVGANATNIDCHRSSLFDPVLLVAPSRIYLLLLLLLLRSRIDLRASSYTDLAIAYNRLICLQPTLELPRLQISTTRMRVQPGYVNVSAATSITRSTLGPISISLSTIYSYSSFPRINTVHVPPFNNRFPLVSIFYALLFTSLL